MPASTTANLFVLRKAGLVAKITPGNIGTTAAGAL